MMTSNDIIQITLFMKALIKTETKIHRLEFKFFKYIMNVQGKTIYSKTENTQSVIEPIPFLLDCQK